MIQRQQHLFLAHDFLFLILVKILVFLALTRQSILHQHKLIIKKITMRVHQCSYSHLGTLLIKRFN